MLLATEILRQVSELLEHPKYLSFLLEAIKTDHFAMECLFWNLEK